MLLDKSGVQSTIEPLIDINFFDGENLDCSNVVALVMTSANGVRAFTARSGIRNIPVYAVGAATAKTAEINNFSSVFSADGNVDELIKLIIRSVNPDTGIILHPAANHVAGDLAGGLKAAGFYYRREVIYEAVSTSKLSKKLIMEIKAGEIDGVTLFSPRTGHLFQELAKKANLFDDLSLMRAYCLSPAVAETIYSLSWLEVCIAKKPNQKALLDLLNVF